MTVTVSGLDKVIVEFESAAVEVIPVVLGVLGKGALNIKNDWRRSWKGLKHAPALPYTIGYDLVTVPGSLQAIIGPDKNRKQGALGNLIEFGSTNNSPTPGGSPALDREAPKFEAAMAAAMAKLLP